jgi:hypothetical protein
MRSLLYSVAFGAAAVLVASGMANAAPGVGTNPAADTNAIQKVQEFGIYVGPRYGYRDRYWDYGYGYGYNPDYYYGPRRYYYNDGYYYRGDRRPFRRLQRQAP